MPEPIEAVVFLCLAKDPDDRPQTARELAELYETALALDHSGLTAESARQPIDRTRPSRSCRPTRTRLTFTMEAWMPESIAVVKLRGFAHDADGQIVESVPGVVRMKLGPNGRSRGQSSPVAGSGCGEPEPFGWNCICTRSSPSRGNKLVIQAVFRPQSVSQLTDAVWRERCTGRTSTCAAI